MPIEKLQRVRVATVAILALVLSAGFLLGAVWGQRLDAQPGSATEGSVVPTRTRARGRTAECHLCTGDPDPVWPSSWLPLRSSSPAGGKPLKRS